MTNKWHIPLFNLSFGEEEKQAILEAIDAEWISMGPRTREFESRWEEYYNHSTLAVSSGTAALALSLKALNLKQGDEVILPSLTFVADANCVLQMGGTPVFADIVSLNYPVISPDDIEKKINSRTAAIIVVHYAGYPAPIDDICRIARKHGIALIEDCAHSPLVKFKNKLLGTFGDFGCFSFFANKNISTAEGGMLICKEREHYKQAMLLRSHGMTALSWDKQQGHSFQYDVIIPGYNYRIDDIRSSIGLAQLDKLPSINRIRGEKTKYYWHLLSSEKGLIIPFHNLGLPSSYYIFPLVLPNHTMRESLADSLRNKGIQTSLHYPPIHHFTAYQSFQTSLPNTEKYGQQALTLPLFPALTNSEIELICDIIISEKIK